MAEPSAIRRVAESARTMANKMLPRFVVGALLAGVTASTFGISLGRMRGTAIVGQNFDATLVAQLGSGERLSDLCVGTEVFFGDSLASSAKVSTSLSAGSSAGEVLIRVRTSSAVDEPVVTVNMREGCLQKNTRKYVFLAEVSRGNAGGIAASSDEVSGTAPAKLRAVGGSGSKFDRTSGSASAVPALPGALRTKPILDNIRPSKAVVDQVGGTATRLVAKATTDSTSKASRSRLKLDPLELGAERDLVLRASSELLTLPSTDPQQRASSAALWQALNAQPQDMLRASQQLQALEMDVIKMLAKARVTDTATTDLRVQFAKSRAERFSNWLVYTLAAVVFLSWLVAAYLLVNRRKRGVQSIAPWWRKGLETAGRESEDAVREALTGETREMPGAADRFGSRLARARAEPLSGTAGNTRSTTPADRFKTVSPLEPKDRVEFSMSLPNMTGMPRIVNAEELFDVQQQADFFVSLGDFDKAIEVLRHHIADNVETSAVAYLDLFDLFHQLGRKDDYKTLSEDFIRTFNAKVPVFDGYKAATQSLESYEKVLSRIVALWPTPKVLEVIEESIFRKPDSKSEVFSLAAYRELLLLHAIAKKVVEPIEVRKPVVRNETTKQARSAYAPTTTQPVLAHLQDLPKLHGFGQIEKKTDPTRPPASRHLGLDIDLNFGLDDFPGKPDAVGTAFTGGDAAAVFTHELLKFEKFSVDPKAPKTR